MSHRLYLLFALKHPAGTGRTGDWPQGIPVSEAWVDIDGHYAAAAEQMPRVLAQAGITLVVEPPLPAGSVHPTAAELRLVVGALGDAVVLLSAELDGALEGVMRTLRCLRDGTLGHCVRAQAGDGPASEPFLQTLGRGGGRRLRHVLRGWETGDVGSGHVIELDQRAIPVLSNADSRSETDNVAPVGVDTVTVNRMLFYDAYGDTSMRGSFAGVEYPNTTNRYEGTLAAIGPNGALLVGFEQRFARAMVLSHVLIRGVRLRAEKVRGSAYADLRFLNDLETRVDELMSSGDQHEDEAALARLRTALSGLSARCGRHRVELAFGAEAMLDLEPVIPSSLVGHYHRSLVRVSRSADMVSTATLLVERLESAIGALRVVIETAEREADERRNSHLGKVGGVLAAVALIISFVFGFYGSNVRPIGDRPILAVSPGYLAFLALGILLAYAVVAALLRDPWLRMGRLGRGRLRSPDRKG